MAFTVELFHFSKKNNSTARPSGGISFTGRIKQPSGILNPEIAFAIGNPSTYNYAYIPTFDRYYYISEWTYIDSLWHANMQVDPLASWKDTIGSSNVYVLRSSSAYNLDIMDNKYPGTNVSTCLKTEVVSPWNTDSYTGGSYVVGVAGQATTYYIFTYTQLNVFFNFILSDNYVALLVDDWSSIFPQAKAQTNPLQYITSIKWFPFTITGTITNMLRVGFVDVETGVQEMTGNGTVSGNTNIGILNHPQSDRGNYLKNSPYSSYTLFFPPWGAIQLDPNLVANSPFVKCDWVVDLRTGLGTLKVYLGPDSNNLASVIQSPVGVEQQVTQIINKGYGFGNLVAPVAGAAAGLAVGGHVGAVAGLIAGGVSAIGDVVSSAIPTATTIGSNGGVDSLIGNPAVYFNFKNIVNEDLTHNGRPLCENKQINTLSGYVLVKEGDISIPCTSQEYIEIKNYLEGGFFYE